MRAPLCSLTGFVVLLGGPLCAAQVNRFEITPTPLVTDDRAPRQRIRLSIGNNGSPIACRLQVWSGERKCGEVDLGTVPNGLHGTHALLPEPARIASSRWLLLDAAGKEIAEQRITWRPPRHWTLYVVKSAHIDIGLHAEQYRQRHTVVGYLEQARELADQTAGWPEAARYRYVVEHLWWWLNFARDRPAATVDRLVRDYVKTGRIGVAAGHSGNHTQEFGPTPDFVPSPETLVANVSPGPYVVVSFDDKGLKPYTTYYYRVRAVDRDGNKGPLSGPWPGTTREPLASPGN